MSISGISSSTSIYQTQLQQMRKDFSTLQASLSSGNLATAQQAYATLTQDMQNAQQAQGSQQAEGSSQLSNDLAAVGSALQTGDVTAAQNAFTTLTQDVQNAQQTQGAQQTYKSHGHHHHHHSGGSKTTATSVSNDLAAVGSALQSGDITGAQSAFTTLMQDLGGNSGQNATGTTGNSLFQAAGSNVDITV